MNWHLWCYFLEFLLFLEQEKTWGLAVPGLIPFAVRHLESSGSSWRGFSTFLPAAGARRAWVLLLIVFICPPLLAALGSLSKKRFKLVLETWNKSRGTLRQHWGGSLMAWKAMICLLQININNILLLSSHTVSWRWLFFAVMSIDILWVKGMDGSVLLCKGETSCNSPDC